MKQFLKLLVTAMATMPVLLHAQCPIVTVMPITQTLTCGGAPVSFTALTNSTVNIGCVWLGPGGLPTDPMSSSPVITSFNNPGTYTFVATNFATNCSTTQTVAVLSNTAIPAITISSSGGSAISCAVPCIALGINASSGPAPFTYTWTNLQTMVSVNPPAGGYTVCSNGNSLAQFSNGFGCPVSQRVHIDVDTLRPVPTATTNLPSNSFTLGCPSSLTATAMSNPTLAAFNYSWTQPSPLMTISGNTIQVSASSISVNPTTYTIYAMGTNGCIGRNKIYFYKDPLMMISGSNTICMGQTTTLTASGASSYTWNTGPVSNSIVVNPNLNTTYTVTGTALGNPTCTAQLAVTVSVVVCSGISEIQRSGNVSVYPNPSNGNFILKVSENGPLDLEIINMLGQKVILRSVNEGDNEIRLGDMPKGVYYYSVKQDKKIIAFGKVLVE